MATNTNVKNSTYNSKNGRYTKGGTTEVSSFALEWWERLEMPTDPSDILYIMEKKYEGRPDMLGHVFYGDSLLWWVIAQYNSILDPHAELVEGKALVIPTLERAKTLFSAGGTTLGGIPSTRSA